MCREFWEGMSYICNSENRDHSLESRNVLKDFTYDSLITPDGDSRFNIYDKGTNWRDRIALDGLLWENPEGNE